MSQYEYDKDGFRFRKAKKSAWHYVRKVLMFFVVTLSLAVVYYLIFALVFSTDTEQRLKEENRMYASELPELERKEEETPDIFQWYIVSDSGARLLEEINEIVYYCSELDIYVWGVTHYGTAWSYVLTNIPCNTGKF